METRFPSLFLSAPARRCIALAVTLWLGLAANVRATIYTQTVIDAAVAQPLLDYANDLQNAPMQQAKAINFMALVVHQDPSALSGGALVSDRLVAQIRSLITGGHEPNANGSLSGWTHGCIAQTFVLAKNTPSVWSQLTTTEKTKIDWLMKAMAIAGHFGFDDGNFYLTGLGNEGNFNKTSNPNYREGYVGVIVAASIYFGASTLDSIFTSFSYDTYIAQFQTYGYTNILARWQASPTMKTLMETGGNDAFGGHGAGVKNTFTYRGVGLSDPFGIFKKLADHTYGSDDNGVTDAPWSQSPNVIDGLTISGTVYSYTMGGASSPWLGRPGQLYEFHAYQGGGPHTPRSSIHYACEGWINSTSTRATLEELGLWNGSAADRAAVEATMQVGSDDVIFKAISGFVGYNGGNQQPPLHEADLDDRGYPYSKEIWLKLLKDTTAPTVALTAPAASSFLKGSVTVSATASDNRQVAGVQFKLDGANLGSEVTTAPYSVSWNTAAASNGNHTLTAVARDVEGNTTTSSGRTVTVDNSAPSGCAVTGPTAGLTVSGSSVVISASAADNNGVIGVQFKLDGANLGAEDLSSPYSITWNTLSVSNGAHTLSMVARDAAGNTTTSSVSITVNNIRNTATTAGGWVNVAIDRQAATFTAQFDSTPSANPIDTQVGFSNGTASANTALAANIRFNTAGNIDARNGGVYSAAGTIPYSANVNYHFRFVVNVAAHTYSAYVTAAGGTEQTIGVNYAFRTEQASVTQLNNTAIIVNSPTNGANEVCNIVATDSALKLWLKLNETAGVVAPDLSASGTNATLVNGASFIGGTVDLDGVDDHLSLPAGQANYTSGFTFAVWAYPASVKNYARFFDFGNGTASDNFYLSRENVTNGLRFKVYNGATGGNAVLATGSMIVLNQWQHFAVTLDSAGNAKIYRNGVLVGSGTTLVPSNLTRSSNFIGRSNWTSDDYFDGALEDIRVYNRVLSATEIQGLQTLLP